MLLLATLIIAGWSISEANSNGIKSLSASEPEQVPGAAKNINFSTNKYNQTVISWDAVNYDTTGAELTEPIAGYTIIRHGKTSNDTLVKMYTGGLSFIEKRIPEQPFLYKYSIIAQTSTTNLGVPAITAAFSGLAVNQKGIAAGTKETAVPFDMAHKSVLSQSIYTAEEIGSTGLITDLTYFGKATANGASNYKVYMCISDRVSFGTDESSMIWENFNNQKLVFNGTINFNAGVNSINIKLQQPFYYTAASNKNIIITIVKPIGNISEASCSFYSKEVTTNRTFYASSDELNLAIATEQPTPTMVNNVPSIIITKILNPGYLTGTVKELDGVTAIEGASVKVESAVANSTSTQVETVLTDASGSFKVPALISGPYKVSFSKEFHNPLETSINIEGGIGFGLHVKLVPAAPIIVSGTVVNTSGQPVSNAKISMSGYASDTVYTNDQGVFALDAFGNNKFQAVISHPLYKSVEISFASESTSFTLEPVAVGERPLAPSNVKVELNSNTGSLNWDAPRGYFNESVLSVGTVTNGGRFGNGSDEFIVANRFLPADLQDVGSIEGKLTHVKVYFADSASVNVTISEGENAATELYTQTAKVTTSGWNIIELKNPISIDRSKELWIGIKFLSHQYSANPLGVDESTEVKETATSMIKTDGSWVAANLDNKNWNIYGIISNVFTAEPTGYKVYRKTRDARTWNQLNNALVSTNSYVDASLSTAPAGIYYYGVEAVYDNMLVSDMVTSNDLLLNMLFNLTIDLDPIETTTMKAYVKIWNDNTFYEKFNVGTGDPVTFENILRDVYNITIELENFKPLTLSDINIASNKYMEIPLTEVTSAPANLKAAIEINSTSANLTWDLQGSYTENFESYMGFEKVNISNYILKDVDGLNTNTYRNFTYPQAGEPTAFMVFNSLETTPVSNITGFNSNKFLAAVASPEGVSDDWFIIPASNGLFSFMAASLSTAGLEKFNVLYSKTGTDAADFTKVSETVSPSTAWTKYTYTMPEGTKYVAINYVGEKTNILKIDDVTYQKPYAHALSYNIYFDSKLVASNVTTNSYTLNNLLSGNHVAEVEAVYVSGLSERAQVSIFSVDVDDINAINFSIYPNPSRGAVSIRLSESAQVRIVDLTGKVVYTNTLDAGDNRINMNLQSGTYAVQVFSGKGATTSKLIIL